ncbi:hypothetical protein [endosymbiont of Riftia pachyptila]|uniref:hypothetical protein n=1 Tax=endosymbiont of Riftia pachyptila TaxID=54396 RepID=UPI0011124210|nr:hypothetical protein [endosymbiont of Riftia pachyptila]
MLLVWLSCIETPFFFIFFGCLSFRVCPSFLYFVTVMILAGGHSHLFAGGVGLALGTGSFCAVVPGVLFPLVRVWVIAFITAPFGFRGFGGAWSFALLSRVRIGVVFDVFRGVPRCGSLPTAEVGAQRFLSILFFLFFFFVNLASHFVYVVLLYPSANTGPQLPGIALLPELVPSPAASG